MTADPDLLFAEILARTAGTPAGIEILRRAGISLPSDHPRDDFRRLPVTSRSEMIDLQQSYPERAGFSTIPLNAYGRIGLHAGGEIDVSYAGLAGAEVMAELFATLGVRRGDIVVNSFGYHMATVAHVFDESLRRLGATVVPVGPGNAEIQANLIARLGATVWLGFPSFLWRVMTQVSQPTVPQSLRLAILGGEFAPTIRRELLDRFSIESRDFYGVSIVGTAAYECESGVGLHVVDTMVVEILDDHGSAVGPGEAGQIVLTPLRNEFAVPRLGTGDLSRWIDKSCECGRPSRRIEGVLGRVGDSVKARGLFIYPRDILSVREALDGVASCTLVVSRSTTQPTRDTLTLHITMAKGEQPATGLVDSARRTFEGQTRLRLDNVHFSAEPHQQKPLVDQRDWEVAAL